MIDIVYFQILRNAKKSLSPYVTYALCYAYAIREESSSFQRHRKWRLLSFSASSGFQYKVGCAKK